MKERALSRPRTLAFFAVVLAVSNLLLLSRFEPREHLTREERGEDLRRLTELAARTHVGGAPGRIVQRTLTFEDRCGTPGGIVVSTQISRNGRVAGPETRLRFFSRIDSSPGRDLSLSNSSRILLTRVNNGTDLVPRGDRGGLWLQLSELGVPAPRARAALLINNLRGRRKRRAASSASMPGLQGLLSGSHCKLTGRDLELLAQLRAVTRGRICDDLDAVPTRCYAPVILLARDRRPGEYLLRLTSGDPRLGSLDLRLIAGERTGGQPGAVVTYTRRGPISLTKPANLFFVHPAPPGKMLSRDDPGFLGLRWEPQGGPSPDLKGTIDLAALLGS